VADESIEDSGIGPGRNGSAKVVQPRLPARRARGNPQNIPGHRLSDYQLPTGSNSEILSVESKFEDGMTADVIAVDDPRSFLHRSKTRLSATN